MNKAIFPRCKNNNKTAVNHATKKFVWNVIYNVRQINSKIFTFKVTFKVKFSFFSHAFSQFQKLVFLPRLGIKYSRKKVKTFPSRKKSFILPDVSLAFIINISHFYQVRNANGVKKILKKLHYFWAFSRDFFPYFYSPNFQHS